jgi:hypothetical protein
MKNSVFGDVTSCDSYKNRCFRGTHCLHHHSDRTWRATSNVSSNWQPKLAGKKYYTLHTTITFLRSVLQFLVTANVVSSSPILVALMIEAIRSSETSVMSHVRSHPKRRHLSRVCSVSTLELTEDYRSRFNYL